ncbi:MAG: hypothetical protein H0X37_04790 [Herpetosiphonaceae bacterium]|nr:hypothetical protein [Herpetosiphonaceae bacterium]
MATASLSIDGLAQRCAEETKKWNDRQGSDPQFCFELLRRALAKGMAEAFTHVYQIYEPQVIRWVQGHSRFALTGENADFFAGAALRTFYFAMQGPKFARFAGVPQVLAYLKMCVHTAIMQYLRDQHPVDVTPLEDVHELGETPDLLARTDAAELWAHICHLLPDPHDRNLARCIFLLDLKPRQIVSAYPLQWSNEREVTVATYRIRHLLRNNAELCRWASDI